MREYAHRYDQIRTKENCLIGVGYTNCIDKGFEATDLFTAIQTQVDELGEITPQVHETINSLKDFVETFLLHFSEGLNGEYATNNVEMFKELSAVVNKELDVSVELGGHATVWAVRAQMENCAVYNTPTPNDVIVEGMRRNENY